MQIYYLFYYSILFSTINLFKVTLTFSVNFHLFVIFQMALCWLIYKEHNAVNGDKILVIISKQNFREVYFVFTKFNSQRN